MDKLKIAKAISTFTNPPIICIPLFLIISIVLSFENGQFNFAKFILLESISIVFASILPMAIIVFWAKKLNTDSDISNREDRFTPLIVGVVSYFISRLCKKPHGFGIVVGILTYHKKGCRNLVFPKN